MKVCFVLTTGFEFDDSLFTSIRETEFDVIPPPQDGLPVLANQQHLGARPKRKNRRGRMSRERAYAKWVSQRQQSGHVAQLEPIPTQSCEGQGQAEPQPTQQLSASSRSEGIELETQWQSAASRTIEITNQTIRVKQTIQNQLPLRNLRNFRRPVAIVHPYVPSVGPVTLRQPRTEPLALQVNTFTPRPTHQIGLQNQLGRGARLQAQYEQQCTRWRL
jgi:hypothetical protein